MNRLGRHAAEEAATMYEKDESVDAVKEDAYNSKKRRRRKLTPLGKFLDVTGTVILIATILICLGLSIPKFAGIDSYVVISGSMEPEIPVGSMVYSRSVDPATLQPGDIIVFYNTDRSDSVPITHRVVENHKETGEIITKGDANESVDRSPAAYVNIVGKVFAHIPGLGYLAAPLATLKGKIAAVLIILAGFLLTEAGNRMRR